MCTCDDHSQSDCLCPAAARMVYSTWCFLMLACVGMSCSRPALSCCTSLCCSEEHIAALCIATPPTQGDASQTVDTTQPSAPPPSPESEDPSAAPFVTLGGMRVTLLRGVPDDTWHRQTLDTDSVGSDRHGTVRVLGSTAYR